MMGGRVRPDGPDRVDSRFRFLDSRAGRQTEQNSDDEIVTRGSAREDGPFLA